MTLPAPYFQDDAVTIYHADCRAIMPHLPKVDLVLTDPPYGVGYKYGDSYLDTGEGYAPFVLGVFEACRAAAPLTLITPGIINLWLYPKADWVLCWAKPGSTRRNGLGGFNEWEPVLVYGKRRIYNDFKYLPDIVNHSTESGDHPAPKPKALYKWLLSVASDDGATLLDPFMGSGTALRAAKDLGRKAIGIEIEERYAEIAAKRMAQGVLF